MNKLEDTLALLFTAKNNAGYVLEQFSANVKQDDRVNIIVIKKRSIMMI